MKNNEEIKINDSRDKFQKILKNIPLSTKIRVLLWMYWRIIKGKLHIPDSKGIWKLRLYGFKPIGYCVYYLEDTWIFETDEEALRAFNKMEKEKGILTGWWYGKEHFLKLISEESTWKPSEIKWLK